MRELIHCPKKGGRRVFLEVCLTKCSYHEKGKCSVPEEHQKAITASSQPEELKRSEL
jgi:hypothetical protein